MFLEEGDDDDDSQSTSVSFLVFFFVLLVVFFLFLCFFSKLSTWKWLSNLFRRPLLAPTLSNELARCLGLLDLVTFGISSTVGSGILVVTGVVAAQVAGPAIIFCFILAAISCLLSAFSYAELASRIPVAGSAYSFGYVCLGEFLGWTVGWNLTLEYSISAAAIARGWSSYILSAFKLIGDLYDIPSLQNPPSWLDGYPLGPFSLGPLALVIILICTLVLLLGVRESARFNLGMAIINVSVIFFIAIVGFLHVKPSNWSPFFPFGFAGIAKGSARVFFSFLGFDSVTTMAGEVRNPTRNIPIGICATLALATLFYVAVSLAITGMVHYESIDVNAPFLVAFTELKLPWVAVIVALGSITILTAALFCSLFAQPRIYFQMAKDGLLWKWTGTVHPKRLVPFGGIFVSAGIAGILAFVMNMNDLADMISIGTLLAFSMVSSGVLVLRYHHPLTFAALSASPSSASQPSGFSISQGLRRRHGSSDEREEHSDDSFSINNIGSDLDFNGNLALSEEDQSSCWFVLVPFLRFRKYLEIFRPNGYSSALDIGRGLGFYFLSCFFFSFFFTYSPDLHVVFRVFAFLPVIVSFLGIVRLHPLPLPVPPSSTSIGRDRSGRGSSEGEGQTREEGTEGDDGVTAFFRCPCVPFVPCLGIFLNVFMLSTLGWISMVRFGAWTLCGVLLYAGYGYRHSVLRNEETEGEGDREMRQMGPSVSSPSLNGTKKRLFENTDRRDRISLEDETEELEL